MAFKNGDGFVNREAAGASGGQGADICVHRVALRPFLTLETAPRAKGSSARRAGMCGNYG